MKSKITLLAALLVAATAIAGDIVSWDANPSSDEVTQYEVCFSSNSSTPKPWPVLATVPALGTLAATNSAPGRFWYYVVAVNFYGKSDPSAVAFRPGSANNPKVR